MNIPALRYMLALVFFSNALANDDISISDVVERLRRSQEAVVTASVDCQSVYKTDLLVPESALGHSIALNNWTNTTATWWVRNDGSWRTESDINCTFRTDKGHTSRTSTLIDVFHGIKNTGMRTSVGTGDSQTLNKPLVIASTSHPEGNPLAFLTDNGNPAWEIIENGNAVRAPDQSLNGRQHIVVRTEAASLPKQSPIYHVFWIDFERGVVARRQSFAQVDKDKTWGLVFHTDCEDYTFHEPSRVWLPATVKTFRWTLDRHGNRKLWSISHHSYNNWEVNSELDEILFSVKQPLKRFKEE